MRKNLLNFQHFGQGKIEFGQGKVREKLGNFVSDWRWPPWICMKCQIPSSRKNKKNIICMLAAEFAHTIVKVNPYQFLG